VSLLGHGELHGVQRIAIQRKAAADADRLDAGRLLELALERAIERRPARGRVVRRPVQIEPRAHDALRVEAGVRVLHMRESPSEQPCTGQEHERDRDLQDDEPVAYARVRRARAAPARALAERLRGAVPQRRERQQAGDDRRERRGGEGEQEHVGVEADLAGARR
jgi:hypothetical protein